MMALSCYPPPRLSSPRMLGRGSASWLRHPHLPVLGLSLAKILPQGSSLPSLCLQHSRPASALSWALCSGQPRCSTPPALSRGPWLQTCRHIQTWGQPQRLVKRAALGRGRLLGLKALGTHRQPGESKAQWRSQLARPSPVSLPCHPTRPGLQCP